MIKLATRLRVMPRLVLVAGCLTLALVPLLAQQQPTFRARTDVVAVDVHVVDGSGRPVSDLRPEDFTITVDNTPRSIVAADYISYPVPVTSRPSGNAEASPYERPQVPVSGDRIAPAFSPGRWILLVIDEENILAGGARRAADAAIRFLDQVQPNDQVGLVVIPKSGVHIDPTTNRAVVKEALQHITGHLVPVE